MRAPRTLILAATAAALAVAPLTLAGQADASPAYSVTVEHCGGGIAITGYASAATASRAQHAAVTRQVRHPGSLRTVQLRHGSKIVKASTRPC